MNHSQKIITKCDGIITNCDSLVYYKVRWTVITNCDSFFITKCDKVYYKLRQVLQSAMIITNCDSTHVTVQLKGLTVMSWTAVEFQCNFCFVSENQLLPEQACLFIALYWTKS